MEIERRPAVAFSAGAFAAAVADVATNHGLARFTLMVFLTLAFTMWLRIYVDWRQQGGRS